MTAEPTTAAPDVPPGRLQVDGATDAPDLVLEDRFSMVPEWVLDADIGDCALRLYAVLLRYGNSTGARMPSRATLAARLRKKSVDTVDRALAELVGLGAVQVDHRWSGHQRLTNQYRIRTSRPGDHGQSPTRDSASSPWGGRTDAATPAQRSRPGRADAATRAAAAGGGHTDRGRVAARIGHDRELLTDRPPPPPARPLPSSTCTGGHPSRAGSRRPNRSDPNSGSVEHWQRRHQDLLTACGITSRQAWDDYVAQVHAARSTAGQPLSRWSPAHLLTALDLAVRGRGWPASDAALAMLRVAGDPATRSTVRLAEAGPWWDDPTAARPAESVDLAAMEAELDTAAGLRVQLQRAAREQLAAEGRPVTRATVLTRATDLLRNHSNV